MAEITAYSTVYIRQAHRKLKNEVESPADHGYINGQIVTVTKVDGAGRCIIENCDMPFHPDHFELIEELPAKSKTNILFQEGVV